MTCFLAAGLSCHPSLLAALSIRLVQGEAAVGVWVGVGPGRIH